jgi:hypothetical protein
MKLAADTIIPDLNKYSVKKEMDSMENEGKIGIIISKSVENQVLSIHTAFICKIKENLSANVDTKYLFEMKNALEGFSKQLLLQ